MPWTAADMPDLDGRRAVVTGANSGIGVHIAGELARHGAEVTLACRNVRSAEQVAARIRAGGGAEARVAELDLASQTSVRAFADGWSGPRDLLVNTAGVMTPPRP
ncbi:MAG: SDR family NAD(P)-dependent oxidoreductase, partial [Nocardioidaceae bacterium]